jgi:hypothetical protein
MPREKKATIVKMSRLRPVLDSIELARKASMASRHGLKPAKRPAAKTVAADETVRSWRAFLEEHVGGATVGICELSPAKAGDSAMTNATVSKIALMQYRTQSILTFLGGRILAFKADPIEGLGFGLFTNIACQSSF